MGKKKAVFNWSGGKDSALALTKVISDGELEVVALLTNVYEETLRSLMHSIPLELLEKQAESIGIPLFPVLVDENGASGEMQDIILLFKKQGVTHFVFGDIFLADIRSYRESKLHPYGIEVVEPLWGKEPEEVMAEFLRSGIKSTIIVTQADKLDRSFIGKDLSEELISGFPPEVDICGENGEYHTFSYEGALFQKKIDFSIRKVEKQSYALRLDSGEMMTVDYWQAVIC